MEKWLGGGVRYVPQGEGDLGERMSQAFKDNFRSRKKRIILVGTDCPELTLFHLKAAFSSLKTHDLVLGPARDGGYCLIGLRREAPHLFRDIQWGTEAVFAATLEKAKASGMAVHCLEILQDVDIPEDLPVWERALAQSISIVVPTLNEESTLVQALESTEPLSPGEVIIADGGSEDRTVPIADEWGAKVVRSKSGRGTQMNTGASASSGTVLLFLHADCRLPPNYAGMIRKALSDPEIGGGAFSLRFDPRRSFLLKINDVTANWRTRLFRLPYGDQAFFVRASLFRLVAGYAEIPLMEDVEFIRRLRKRAKLAFLSAPVLTSPRKYLDGGILRTTWKNKAILLSYLLGVSPFRLARMYYGKRRPIR